MLQRVVVVGASLAGVRACETLRLEGFDGHLTLVGAEPHPPYDRPPLSKQLLAGEWEPERILLRRPDEHAKLGLDHRPGVRAVAVDTEAKRVALDDGNELPYDGLVIATGGVARRLPGQPELPGIHVLRTLDDALSLGAELQAKPRVVVVGAGFIGSEVASTSRRLGCEVSVVEALPVPLGRVFGAEVGGALAALHQDHGVRLHLGVGVGELRGGERVEQVVLADGTVLAADTVVVGVGVAPATDWLEGSQLTLRDGVVCDATLCAGPPGVYAAGDVCRWTNPLLDEEMRVEHWTNAAEQGAAAARNLLSVAAGGAPTPFASVPFFWSDQYSDRIQCLGRSSPDDDVEIAVGSVEDRRFLALYSRGDRLRAAFALNLPRPLMGTRRLLLAGASIDEARAAVSV